jgi:hypothetical protein
VIAFAFGMQGACAGARSQDVMVNECSSIAQSYCRDFDARTETQHSGP